VFESRAGGNRMQGGWCIHVYLSICLYEYRAGVNRAGSRANIYMCVYMCMYRKCVCWYRARLRDRVAKCYIYIHRYSHMYADICLHTYIYIYTYINIYIHSYTLRYVYIFICIYVYKYRSGVDRKSGGDTG